MSNYTVYMHTCPNGKRYIGITCQYPLKKRFKNGNGYINQSHFHRAIQKYGWDNIEHKIMSNWHTQEEAEKLERLLIEKYQTNNSKYGYNKNSGGLSGGRMAEETKRILSDINLGKKHTEETRKKISLALSKRQITEETRKKMSNGNKGKIISNETKIKISQRLKGRKRSEESIKKTSEFNRGKKRNQESIKKMRESQKKSALYRQKKVNQLTQEGNLIKEFESISSVIECMQFKSHSGIYKTCNGKQKTAYGYRWEYAEEQT